MRSRRERVQGKGRSAKSKELRAGSVYEAQDSGSKTGVEPRLQFQSGVEHTHPLIHSPTRPSSLRFGSCAFFVVAVVILISCFPALTEVADRDVHAPEAIRTIIHYSAKDASSDRKSGVTILKGDAKIRRGDGDYLNSDQITMYKDVETGELIKIEAVGDVDMKEKDMTGTCERAIFYEKDDRIELEGSEDSPAVVDDGNNRMEALAITYFRKEDRLDASGNVSGHVTIEEKEGEATEEEVEEKGEK